MNRSLLLSLVLAGPLAAQVRPIPASADTVALALSAERRGAWAEAAALYGALLAAHPANANALMGMERALPKLDRRAELVPLISRAAAVDSTGFGLLLVAVRTFTLLGAVDSVHKYVEIWAKRSPGDEAPYREWEMAAVEARDMVQAQVALEYGRTRLPPPALALDLAQLLQLRNDMPGAVREWLLTLKTSPMYRDAAVSMLSRTALAQRPLVLDALRRDGSSAAKQVLGLLLGQWGEATEGAALVRGALPADRDSAVAMLTTLLNELRGKTDRPSMAARGATLEAIAQRHSGSTAARSTLEAARAYADAGDERNARRLLAVVGADPSAPPGMGGRASTALLGVLLAEGKPAEAEKVLADLAPSLPIDERDAEARRVAVAWIHQGDLARAERLIAADSSVEGFDLRGRVHAFEGDLAGATLNLKTAGPYADERDLALQRVTLLALLQAIGMDSLPALGAALLELERGDSARAVTALDALAATLKAPGAAETSLLAGRVALALRDSVTAMRLLHRADVHEAPASAAAARLDLARMSAAAGHASEARAMLESLILDFPESAVVPEARRLRDLLAGAIPGGGT